METEAFAKLPEFSFSFQISCKMNSRSPELHFAPFESVKGEGKRPHKMDSKEAAFLLQLTDTITKILETLASSCITKEREQSMQPPYMCACGG